MVVRVLLAALVLVPLAAAASTASAPATDGSSARAETARKPAARRAAVERPTVEVSFVRNGRLVRVERVVPKRVRPEVHALRELLQGPTKDERRQGLRSAIRSGARLQSVRREDGLWLVRFSRSLLATATARTIDTRFAQITATLRLLGSEQWAVVSTEGRFATTLRVDTRTSPWRAASGEKNYLYSVRGVQLRLWLLGFLDRSSVTGTPDYQLEQALLAFQGWNDLGRTGTVTGETQVALVRATAPRPVTHRSGRRVEIHRDRGVLLMVDGNEVLRAVHTSTGAYGGTPAGTFRVYRKELYSWSVPFSVWMPYASYFNGGIAMHEYPHVPEYPASHGCVRLPDEEAERVYRFAEYGTPVHVF
jgi:lipoprotein-anchoring transpeptidase ErfK/SrfK